MTFRGRLLIAFLSVVLIPLAVLAIGVRNEMRGLVLAQTQRRAEALAGVIAGDLSETHESTGASLAAIVSDLGDDPRFRAGALRPDAGERAYVIDYAAAAMRATGLSVLQIRNDSGRILSSGHFPAEFDRIDAGVPDVLGSILGPALLATRTAEGTLIAIASLDSLRIGGRIFTLIGGRSADQRFVDRLAGGGETGVILTLPDTTLRSTGTAPAAPLGSPAEPDDARRGVAPIVGDDGTRTSAAPTQVVRVVSVPFVDATRPGVLRTDAEFAIVRSLADEQSLRRSIDRWIVATFLLATAAAVLAALWLAARLSRPMEELALATSTVDLDRLDVRFATGRDDEIGVLSRRLSAMVDRLRGSTARLRDAERRAAVADISRQVNHDIKNGLAPIRNVVRHLAEVARDQPATLPAIFTERQGTLESSIAYLETLARNYARLSPTLATTRCDVAAVITEVVGGVSARGATVSARTAARLPSVHADAVILRRIIENLVSNAIESLEGRPGEVSVSAEPIAEQRGPLVRIIVADTGRGMSERELARAFDDFYTTKPDGTGLGLSVVRRLVADLGGALRVETEPGVGTRISVDLPAAGTAPVSPPAATPPPTSPSTASPETSG